uniref:Uncharacterized protein n=1 Tax=Marseillevirus sp. TaxID=2809551 RepID=A0AA96EQ91_9VIRU|nr:hypothetical protein MarDSR_327 [Marseillevirus sp.]
MKEISKQTGTKKQRELSFLMAEMKAMMWV